MPQERPPLDENVAAATGKTRGAAKQTTGQPATPTKDGNGKRAPSTVGLDYLAAHPGAVERLQAEEDFTDIEMRPGKKFVPPTFTLTDTGNAERLVREHGEDIRYCGTWKKWVEWDGARWAMDRELAVLDRAKDTLRGLYAEAAGELDDGKRRGLSLHARASESARSRRATVDLARAEKSVRIESKDFDRNVWRMTCPNGTLALHLGELQEHRREDYITKLCPTPFDPKATCPTWDEFVLSIFGGDIDMVAFLARALGYSLTGDCREDKIFICHGSGANGKSTLVNCVGEILGEDYYAETAPDVLVVRKTEHHQTELAILKGKRFVSTQESTSGARLAEGLVKRLTGRDTLTARRMYQDLDSFRPEFKIWFATNHRPDIRDTSCAIWRRVALLPFSESFIGREDRELAGKLRKEAPGILAWMVRGCMDWQRIGGLDEPKAVTDATNAYRAEQDQLQPFIEDRCEMGPLFSIPRRELYLAYQGWVDAEIGGDPESSKRFSARMREKGFRLTRSRGKRVWVGIRIPTGEKPTP